MYIRASRLRIPRDRIDAAIALFGDEVAPSFRAEAGNVGAILLVDREKGQALGLTYWESKEALDASEEAGTSNRTRVTAATGATVEDVDRFELAVMERAAEPRSGRFVRVSDFPGDRERLDAGIAALRDRSAPAVRGLRGFAALIYAVNRTTGRGIVTSVWDTLEDLQASEAAVSGLRSDIASATGTASVQVDVYQAAFVDLRLPVTI